MGKYEDRVEDCLAFAIITRRRFISERKPPGRRSLPRLLPKKKTLAKPSTVLGVSETIAIKYFNVPIIYRNL
jgi:hypothetical protein